MRLKSIWKDCSQFLSHEKENVPAAEQTTIACARLFLVWVLSLSGTAQSNAGGLTFVEVADTNTSILLGTGNFTSFGLPAIDGNYIAFDATGSNGQDGIYPAWSQAGGLSVTDNNGTSFSTFLSPTVDAHNGISRGRVRDLHGRGRGIISNNNRVGRFDCPRINPSGGSFLQRGSTPVRRPSTAAVVETDRHGVDLRLA